LPSINGGSVKAVTKFNKLITIVPKTAEKLRNTGSHDFPLTQVHNKIYEIPNGGINGINEMNGNIITHNNININININNYGNTNNSNSIDNVLSNIKLINYKSFQEDDVQSANANANLNKLKNISVIEEVNEENSKININLLFGEKERGKLKKEKFIVNFKLYVYNLLVLCRQR